MVMSNPSQNGSALDDEKEVSNRFTSICVIAFVYLSVSPLLIVLWFTTVRVGV